MPIILNGTSGIITPGITNTGPFIFEGPVTVPVGSASSPSVSFTGSTNTGLYLSATGAVSISTAGTQRVVVSASGDVGIGASSPAAKLEVDGQEAIVALRVETSNTGVSAGNYSEIQLADTGSIRSYWRNVRDGSGATIFSYNDNLRISQGSTEVARFTLAGNFGIGTTSPESRIHAQRSDDGVIGTFRGTSTAQYLVGIASGNVTHDASNGSATHAWLTNGTERARITSGGQFQVGGTSLAGDNLVTLNNSSATGYGISVTVNNNSSNVYRFFEGVDSGPTQRIAIYTNGDVKNTNNSYGALSDEKLKQDIVDAGSQWSDIKNLRVRKYRFKDKPNDALQIGLIAQEVEQVSPGLIVDTSDEVRDENGQISFTGETTKTLKYSVVYMKAIKALQEAMARIEQLEAKFAALESK